MITEEFHFDKLHEIYLSILRKAIAETRTKDSFCFDLCPYYGGITFCFEKYVPYYRFLNKRFSKAKLKQERNYKSSANYSHWLFGKTEDLVKEYKRVVLLGI